jgi:hypothetical protein
MTSKSPEILRDREKSLEDEFFRREDKRLIERLKELKAVEATRDALAKASGATKPAVLEELMELGIRAETMAALFTVPLVEVAWADGTLDAKERRAVVDRAGVARDSTAGALFAAWLDRRPDPKLLAAWTHLVQGMCEQLDECGCGRPTPSLIAGRRNRRRRSERRRPFGRPTSSPGHREGTGAGGGGFQKSSNVSFLRVITPQLA